MGGLRRRSRGGDPCPGSCPQRPPVSRGRSPGTPLPIHGIDSEGAAAPCGRGEPDEALRESCWAPVPPELLRMVLARVEDEEAWWPGRGAIVACAGVCRC